MIFTDLNLDVVWNFFIDSTYPFVLFHKITSNILSNKYKLWGSHQFLNGNGEGKPLGIFAVNGGGEVAVTTASSTAITYDEIVNLVYALKRPYRKNAKFILNDQTIATLRKLKDGNGQYIWQPALQAGEPDRLLGYEVLTSAYVPTIEAGAPVIAFGDFSYYNIGDRGVRSFAELKELFAGNGMIGFVAKERVDGKLVLPEAVKILKIKA